MEVIVSEPCDVIRVYLTMITIFFCSSYPVKNLTTVSKATHQPNQPFKKDPVFVFCVFRQTQSQLELRGPAV